MDRTSQRTVEFRLRNSRRGLTLVETIVAMAIIGLLMAIIVPAVQAARTTSRRMQCQNNLRQITLAMNSYADSFGTLPQWAVPNNAFDISPNGYEGAFTAIFPYLDLPEKRDAIARGMTRIPVLECPADSDVGNSATPLSYRLNASPGPNSGYLTLGPFIAEFGRPPVRLRDVIDGTSQTACCSEGICLRLSNGNQSVAAASPSRYTWTVKIPPLDQNAATPLAALAVQTDLSINECLSDPRLSTDGGTQLSNASWQIANDYQTAYTHWFPPNAPFCRASNFNAIPIFLWDNHGAASAHDGGVNVSYLDGHVKFISQAIDRNVWRAVGTINGIETNTEGAY